ncbi:hypothetical protein [Nannocystis pusilla]
MPPTVAGCHGPRAPPTLGRRIAPPRGLAGAAQRRGAGGDLSGYNE